MKLNEDGTAEIEFDRPDGTTFTVKIKRPTVGQFKRLRIQAQTSIRDARQPLEDWNTARAERTNAIADGANPNTLPPLREYADVQMENDEMMSAAAVAWWNLVLVGDDSFKPLGDKPADVKAISTDDWPSYLIYGAEETRTADGLASKNGTALVLLAHWQAAPLDRGVKQPALN